MTPAASLRRPLVQALVVLTVVTGVVDAVSYLGLGRVFTANMTGNTVLLGFALAGAPGLPVVSPLIALAAFLSGAAAGGALTRAREQSIPPARLLVIAITTEAAILLTATLVAVAVKVEPNHASGDALVAALAAAMGLRNAVVRRVAVPDLTTTVLTMTLTGLAADRPTLGVDGATGRRLAAVLTMLCGALVGALLVRSSPQAGLGAGAGLAVVALALGARDHQPAPQSR